MVITFAVPFVLGQARPRFGKNRTYKPEKDRQAEKQIKNAYEGACLRKFGHVPCASKGIPVTLVIMSQRALPKSRPLRILREHDTMKPDASNVAKLIEDALNEVAYLDDSQVTHLYVFKRDRVRGYGDQTTVTIIWEGEENGTE